MNGKVVINNRGGEDADDWRDIAEMHGEVACTGGGSTDEDFCSDDDGEEPTYLTPNTLLQLKRDDPTITHLQLSFGFSISDEFDSNNLDWKNDGQFIGSSTNLKKLVIRIFISGVDAKCNEFYDVLARNRSIVNLQVHHEYSHVINGVYSMFVIPSSFYENNHNLLSFQIVVLKLIGDSSLNSLVSGLKERINKSSLQHLTIHCEVKDDESRAKLIDALHGYQMKTLSLSLGTDTSHSKKWCATLGRLLESPSSKLEKLFLDNNSIDDLGAKRLGCGLAYSRTVKELSLTSLNATTDSPNLSPAGWQSLFLSLRARTSVLEKLVLKYTCMGSPGVTALCNAVASNPHSKLKILDIGDAEDTADSGADDQATLTGDEGSFALANLLATNTNWHELNLSQSDWISPKGWQILSSSLNNPHLNLEALDLSFNNMCDIGVQALGSALLHNTRLKKLCLECNRSITLTGWRNFFRLLHDSISELEMISLSYNHIHGEDVDYMADALTTISSLKSLHLPDNVFITCARWQRVSSLLHQPDSTLEELCLLCDSSGSNITDEVVAEFANALVNNTSLKKLYFDFSYDRGNMTTGLDTLASVLYNKTSIDAIFASNHTLQAFQCGRNLPIDLSKYLELNRNSNKNEVARAKILRHFLDGDGDVHELVQMEMKTMPFVIALIGKKAAALPLLYRLTQGLSSLFDSDCKMREDDGILPAIGKKRMV